MVDPAEALRLLGGRQLVGLAAHVDVEADLQEVLGVQPERVIDGLEEEAGRATVLQ